MEFRITVAHVNSSDLSKLDDLTRQNTEFKSSPRQNRKRKLVSGQICLVRMPHLYYLMHIPTNRSILNMQIEMDVQFTSVNPIRGRIRDSSLREGVRNAIFNLESVKMVSLPSRAKSIRPKLCGMFFSRQRSL